MTVLFWEVGATLTDTAIKTLKPKDKVYKITDRDGMYVRVMPSGAICGALARPCSTHSTLTATGRAAQGVDEKARLKLFEHEVKELLRPLEQRVEAVRPFEQGGRVRGLLRHAGGDEPIGASDPDVRFHDRARACVGSGRKGGARRSSPRPLAWRLHDQDPRKGGRPRRPDRLRSDRRRSLGLHPLRDPARRRAGHIPSRRHCRQACPELVEGGYSSKANRAAARTRGIAPVIPHKADEKNKPGFFARTLYKARERIEQGFGRLKRFKRVALRCEKTAENYRSIVSFAAGLCLIKFVHTA